MTDTEQNNDEQTHAHTYTQEVHVRLSLHIMLAEKNKQSLNLQ